MEKITEKIIQEAKPFVVIAGYKRSYDYYFESHDVNDKGQVLAGKPLSNETVEKMISAFQTQKSTKQPSGLIPKQMIYMNIDNEVFVWSCPGIKRMLYFKDTFIGNGEANVPNMIFKATGKSLCVFAVKDLSDENADLFVAPFPNCYPGGNVCQGSAKTKLKGNTFQYIIDYWETIFWASEFTHLNGGVVSKGNITLMWKDLIKTGGRFPVDQLVNSQKKLRDLYK